MFDRFKHLMQKNDLPNKDVNNDPDDNGKALYVWIKNKLDESRMHPTRMAHEATWLTNSAAVLGFSGVQFDIQSRTFRQTGNTRGLQARNRPKTNRILPTLQNRLARLTKNRPKYAVRPNSNSEEHKDAARLAEQILDMIWYQNKFPEKQMEMLMLMETHGHAYIHVHYDDTKGELIFNPETGEADFQGKVSAEVVSAFEIFPDPMVKTFDESIYFIRAKLRKLDYFRSTYEKGNLVTEESAWLLSTQFDLRINGMNADIPGALMNTQVKDAAIEISYYERPTKKYPRGRLIIGASGIILEDKELPLGKIPFVKFDDILIGGKYYPESLVSHLRPVQEQLDRVIQKRADWTNKLLSGKILAARGSELQEMALNTPGSSEVTYYTPVTGAAPPLPLQMPAIPSYAYTEEEQLNKIFDQISGINEVSQGVAPSASTPAIAMQFLAEQDATRLGIVARRLELGMAQVGSLLLETAHQNIKVPQLLKIAGQNMKYTVKEFVGADIAGQTDVHVVEGSTLPGSMTAKREELKSMWQMGLFGNPQDPEVVSTVLERLEYGDTDQYWQKTGLKLSKIRDAINMIKAGEMPLVDEFDDTSLYLIKLDDFRLSDSFDALSPESKDLFYTYRATLMKKAVEQTNPELTDEALEQQRQLDQIKDETAQAQNQEDIISEEEKANLIANGGQTQ